MTDNRRGVTLAPDHAVGFLTDASLCIGCKACEVACKQWNQLPADGFNFTGNSYDNTRHLSETTWRHVAFVERASGPATAWLMLSDVCKHCVHAGCMEACPTGAIIRTEFESVYIQPDICNGCGYCVRCCPFGVPQLVAEALMARKCSLCYDRLRDGLEPACAKTCPTDSIRFGPVADLMAEATARVETLRARGVADAQIYGDLASGGTNGIGGLNAIFVLNAAPETFNLPAAPSLPADRALPAYASALAAAAGLLGAAFLAFGRRRS
jgi:formate dehydrogenase iron-sulfur subunit